MRRLAPFHRLPLLSLLAWLTACDGGGGGGSSVPNPDSSSGGSGIGQTLTLTLPASGLAAADLAVVVAEGDALSEAVGAAYVAAGGIPAANLIRVKVNAASAPIPAVDFSLLKSDIEAKYPAGIRPRC